MHFYFEMVAITVIYFLLCISNIKKPTSQPVYDLLMFDHYFFKYITSFTSFTVRLTSGNAAATRLGA